jgi:hypothetical protein
MVESKRVILSLTVATLTTPIPTAEHNTFKKRDSDLLELVYQVVRKVLDMALPSCLVVTRKPGHS